MHKYLTLFEYFIQVYYFNYFVAPLDLHSVSLSLPLSLPICPFTLLCLSVCLSHSSFFYLSLFLPLSVASTLSLSLSPSVPLSFLLTLFHYLALSLLFIYLYFTSSFILSMSLSIVNSWMVTLGEFPLSVIPLQPAPPPPFLPSFYDRFLQYRMEYQQAFRTFRDRIPLSVRQCLMFVEFLIVYSAAISWIVHLPLAIGRVGLKFTRCVLVDTC